MKSFQQTLSSTYVKLSPKLKEAANFIVANPAKVATHSLRSVAHDARLAPVTFTRLARAVGYQNYEELRDVMRAQVSQLSDTFSHGLQRLRDESAKDKMGFADKHLPACAQNLQALNVDSNKAELETVVEQIHKSRKVVVLGSLGSTGISEYMSYMASLIVDNWQLVGRMGSSLGGSLVGLDHRDSLIVITKPPYARISIQAAEMAQKQGVFVIVITDTHTCPAIAKASASFIVPTTSSHFFSSYVSTLALIECMIGMLAERAGPSAQERISKIEASNRSVEYYSNHDP